jgi:ssDNA-binding replication factor A large subunit
MSDIHVVDKFSGFLTKEQAERLLKEGEEFLAKPATAPKRHYSAKELLSPNDTENTIQTDLPINVKDRIYRIFNANASMINGREAKRRKVILGEEGCTIVLNLKDRLSDLIDLQAFERGDVITVNNVFIDPNSNELKSIENTSINRLRPSQTEPVTDYSKIDTELKKIDFIGRIVEIGIVKYTTILDRPGKIPVSECVITDSLNSIPVSFWGSSAISTEKLKTNDAIKIEFCDVKIYEGKPHIYANDNSRIIANPAFAERLKGKQQD